eukprot:scaffold48618_cov39-Phaeocystis_antarctica.AAC.1
MSTCWVRGGLIAGSRRVLVLPCFTYILPGGLLDEDGASRSARNPNPNPYPNPNPTPNPNPNPNPNPSQQACC